MTANNTPIMEKEHVRAFMDTLRDNNARAPEIVDVIKLFAAVESDLNKTISSLQRDINAMRQEAAHPLKTAWEKAANGLMSRLKGLTAALVGIKNKIVDACKNAVETIKDKGVIALNDAAEFLGIRRNLEATRDRIGDCSRYNEGQIAKVEAASAEFHAASRHIKNIGRALTGKEPIPEIRPNGKLARLAEAPFRSEIKSLNRSMGRVNKMLAGLDRLEKAAELRRQRDRPSTVGNMKRLGEQVRRRKLETPAKDRGKDSAVEVS